jgi:predicted ferric reductase
MLAGLSITGKTAREWPGMAYSFGVHRYTTLLGLGFAVLHAFSLLADPFMGYTIGQILTPFLAGSYKPQWIGLGQFALYALAVVSLSFYARNRIGIRAWRLIHSLSFALFLTALIHGLQTGSDSAHWWASALYWVSAATVLFGSIFRVLSARAGRPRPAAAATGLIIIAGKAQTPPSARVLQPLRVTARD